MSQAHTRQSKKPTLVIVSPALARANNGNWQTAKRYRQLLQAHFRVRLVSEWHGEQSDDLMIALHARRSHASIAAWHGLRGSSGLVVVLTGTDCTVTSSTTRRPSNRLTWQRAWLCCSLWGLMRCRLPCGPKPR